MDKAVLRAYPKLQKPDKRSRKDYLMGLNSEEARQVVNLWRSATSRKFLIDFAGNQHASTIRLRL